MLNENFRDILKAFDEAGAEYLLVGAYAMAVYANKLASGREKDLLDARLIRQILP